MRQDLCCSIREMSAAYLDPLVGAARFDFIDELAGKVPMDVISEMLGVPRADRAELRRRADLLVHREEGHTGVPPEGVEAFAWIRSYFRQLLAARRVRPGDDLLSVLLEVESEGERLDKRLGRWCDDVERCHPRERRWWRPGQRHQQRWWRWRYWGRCDGRNGGWSGRQRWLRHVVRWWWRRGCRWADHERRCRR